jgi:hypothetical protein
MGIDYDSWLEQPYQDQYAWDELCEEYDESDQYADDLADWLADPDNEGKTQEDWYDSYDYQSSVERWAGR